MLLFQSTNNSAYVRSQCGAALMSMLLVTALLTVLAAQLIRQSNEAIKSTGRAADSMQTYWYARAAENFAISVLAEDARESMLSNERPTPVDSFHDVWAQSFAPFNPADATLEVAIVDLNGCFNVNSLAATGLNAPQPALARLLHSYDVPIDGIAELSAQVEQLPLHSVAQLAAVLKLDPDKVSEISRSICVLPSEQNKVNINTASPELLMVLLGAEVAVEMIKLRKQRAISPEEVAGLSNNMTESTTLVVSSDYFYVQSTAQYAGKTRSLGTRLFRDQQGAITVIDRQEGRSVMMHKALTTASRS